jgi:hypothetical protein
VGTTGLAVHLRVAFVAAAIAAAVLLAALPAPDVERVTPLSASVSLPLIGKVLFRTAPSASGSRVVPTATLPPLPAGP